MVLLLLLFFFTIYDKGELQARCVLAECTVGLGGAVCVCVLLPRGWWKVSGSPIFVKQQHRKKLFPDKATKMSGVRLNGRKQSEKSSSLHFFVKVGPVLIINASACLSYRSPCGCYIVSNLF